MRDALSLVFGSDTPMWMREPFEPLDWEKLRLMLHLFWTEIAANEEAKPYLTAMEVMGQAASRALEEMAVKVLNGEVE